MALESWEINQNKYSICSSGMATGETYWPALYHASEISPHFVIV